MQSPNRQLIVVAFTLLLGSSPGWVTAESAKLDDRSTGALTVHVQGLKSDDGKLRFVLFDSEKTFMKHPIREEISEIQDRQSTWSINELPYGTYAVLVHHDVNASGTMERHWYGKPKEPTGASNDAPAEFGPPKFKHAKFQLETPELTLTITIK